jgi:hypothetical protein
MVIWPKVTANVKKAILKRNMENSKVVRGGKFINGHWAQGSAHNGLVNH